MRGAPQSALPIRHRVQRRRYPALQTQQIRGKRTRDDRWRVRRRLLDGYRGSARADVAALEDAILRFAAMAQSLGDRLVEARSSS
ncbi:hypothetical protein [Bordetella genomosp. 9]|uniref:hypothetical protein n=1 Tax=Bordetella genomosp. 9 TaxID=1416803 RepID=UPI0012FCCC84|nr:hypothetical protein [Bordetella genomosp. 9]